MTTNEKCVSMTSALFLLLSSVHSSYLKNNDRNKNKLLQHKECQGDLVNSTFSGGKKKKHYRSTNKLNVKSLERLKLYI